MNKSDTKILGKKRVMKEIDKIFLDKLIPDFTKNCIINIDEEDLLKFRKGAKAIYYNEYYADDKYRAVRISERIKCDLAKYGNDNKAALYITGDPEMDELTEILDGLHGKTSEIIWGSCNNNDLGIDALKAALLFYVL